MAQDVGSEDVAVDDGTEQRRRRGLLSLIFLAALIALILWLVWQFSGRVPQTSAVTVSKTSTIDVSIPPTPPEPVIPAAAELTVTADENSRVPDVVGESQASAVRTLEGAGYVARVTHVFSDSTPSGLVIQQNPSGGTSLRTGAVVNIFVSRGTQATPMVTMPNVVGMTQSQATAKVKAAGLKPYILHGTDQRYAGRVGNQWPLGGTRLPKGRDGFIQVMIVR